MSKKKPIQGEKWKEKKTGEIVVIEGFDGEGVFVLQKDGWSGNWDLDIFMRLFEYLPKQPEVGDVWEHKKHKTLLHIIKVGANFITFLGFEDEVYPHKTYRRYYTNSFSDLGDDPRYTNFTEIFEYKGKSKAKIEDLFLEGETE